MNLVPVSDMPILYVVLRIKTIVVIGISQKYYHKKWLKKVRLIMQRKTIRAIAFLSVVFLVACGDDNASNGKNDTNSSSDESYASIDDLPNCTAKREGVSAFVEEDDATYICNDDDWVKVGTIYESVDDFPNCTEKRKDESVLEQSTGKTYICNGKSWKEDGVVAKPVESSSSEKKTNSSSSSKKVSSDSKSSSSETQESSSSVAYASPCKSGDVVDKCEYGTLMDSRDGQTYKTVVIGAQTWMAENLNFETSNSSCYDDNASNCAKYGRLYTWTAAMDGAGEWSANGKGCSFFETCLPTYPVRGVCPDGWHLPSQGEWEQLLEAVGGSKTAGGRLVSTSGSGSDAYSFAAILAGYLLVGDGDNDEYRNEGNYTGFWIPSEFNSNSAYYMSLYKTSEPRFSNIHKRSRLSVRCIMDDSLGQKSPSIETQNSSSSVSHVKLCKRGGVDTCEYGTLVDSRDDQNYKTVVIGTQTWMAENLNYEYKVGDSTYGTYVNADSGEIYGRYYTWAAAMDSAGIFSNDGKGCGILRDCSPVYPVRGICPEGWHLPDLSEWTILYQVVDSSPYTLQAEGFEQWPYAIDGVGFSALPAGRLDFDSKFSYFGTHAYFAIADGRDMHGIWFGVYKDYLADYVYADAGQVRCIKD